MSNYKEKNQKNQVFSEIFKEFIKSLAFLKDFRRHSVLKFWESKFADKIVFVPQSFSWDEEKRKVNKKPLLKKSWKTEITSEDVKYWLGRIADSYSAGIYNAGVALRAEDQDLFVIDIDDVNKFSKYFSIENFLEDVKKDTYLITKSISKGYHIYLSPELLQVPAGISNKDLLDNFGFEIKKQGLITFFPSAYRNGEELLSYDILYVNPDNLEKREVKSDSLKKIRRLVKDLHAKKQKKLEELQKIRQRINEKKRKLAEERESFSDFREVIDEVKRRVSFYDLVPEKFVKHCSHYDLYHCPFHQPDRTPSFAVYRDGEYEFGYDFHDNEGYDIIAFYQEYYNTDFITALKELSRIANVELSFSEKQKDIREYKEIKKRILNNQAFETETAFYTAPFSFSKIKKRYAFVKKSSELWEVQEVKEISDTQINTNSPDKIESFFLKKVKIYDKKEKKEKEAYEYVSFYYSKLVASFRIVEGIKYIDPLGSLPKFDFVIITKNRTQKIENTSFEDFVMKMKNESMIISNQKIRDALSKCIDDLITEKKITERVEIPKPGIFFFNSSFKLSRIQVRDVSKEDLKKALIFLNELIDIHYGHMREKSATIFKWFITAPFTFAVKQRKNMLKGLYLFGPSGIGKTTITTLFANLYRNYCRIGEKAGSSIDTIARLGNTLSEDTFPKIISEPKGALSKEDIMEAIKNAMTNIIARGKYSYGQYIEIPALSNIVFTSNHFVPNDDAFIRRFFIISFSISERPKEEQSKSFNTIKTYAEQLLSHIGDFIISNINKYADFLLELSEDTQFKIAEKILKEIYTYAGLTTPEWIALQCEDDFTLTNYEDELRMAIISEIKDYIRKELKIPSLSSIPSEELPQIIEQLPFAFVKKDMVYLTTKILSILNIKIATLKNLAEIMHLPHVIKSFKIGTRSSKISTIKIPVHEFVKLLSPDMDETSLQESVTEKTDVESLSPDILDSEIPF